MKQASLTLNTNAHEQAYARSFRFQKGIQSNFYWLKKRFGFVFLSMLIGIMVFGPTANAQDPAQYGTPFSGVPDPRDAVIYQVNMRCFSSTRNLQGVINRLDNIKALGVNVIQLMPVQPASTGPNSFNSPYAWSNFTTVGAEYGNLTTLRALVDGAHARGMAVIMDWVANQTGWDHPWITQYPERYVRVNGVIQSLNGWTDVAALDRNNATVRNEMINAMRYWVFAANIDGFRCDYANGAPATFWSPINSNLKNIPNRKILMVAEGDGSYLYGAGFDMTFSWTFYGNMKSIQSGSAATIINNTNTSDYAGATGSQQVIRWLSNHDIYGSEGSPYNVLGGKNSVIGKFLITAYMKSVPFIYNGMEVGNTVALPFPFTSSVINWSQDASVTPEFTKIIAHRNYSNAIRRGTLTTYSNNDVCVFSKVSGGETVFVMVNMRNAARTVTLPSGIASTTMYNAFTDAAVNLGTTYNLTAYQYVVLKRETVANVPVTGVTLSPASATVNRGSTIQLTATVAPANATNKAVTYTSGNTAVATVNANGLVTAVANGTATITVRTTDGARTATCAITVVTPSSTAYSIRNRWNGTYLHDAGANVGYGASVANNNYKWERIAVDATYFTLRNVGTGQYAHIENLTGLVQCTAVTPGWWSAQWSADYIDGTWIRIRNRWQTGSIFHVENQNGSVQYAGAADGWWSAQWQLQLTTASGLVETGVENLNANNNLLVYPNPVENGKITVSLNADKSETIVKIFDLHGKLILQSEISASQNIIDVSEIKSGIYTVSASNNSNVYFQKLIVK